MIRLSAVAALALMLAPVPALAAPAPGTPEAIMAAAYKALEGDAEPPYIPFSARLKALFAQEKREVPEGDLGRLDFDWLVDGQDSKVTATKITSRTVEFAANRKIVVVRFKNFDKALENHFFWEKDAKGKWVLDDVRSIEPDGPGFTLSLVLKYGWDGAEEMLEGEKAD